MATYKAVLHHRTRADGTRRVGIRVTKLRKSTYKGLEIYIEEKHFDEGKGVVRKSHKMHEVYNTLIRKKIEEFRVSEMKLESIDSFSSSRDIKAEHQSNFTTDLLAFYKNYIKNKKDIKESTHKQAGYVLSTFEKFMSLHPGMSLQQFNLEKLESFQAWLLKLPVKPITANQNCSVLASVITSAVNKGLIPHHRNPFNHFKYLKVKEEEKDFLTVDEIMLISAYNPRPKVRKYRDIFLFQFLAHGMRASDAMTMKVSNIVNGRIKYEMMKTGKKKSILITGRLKELLDYYIEGKGPDEFIFPILTGHSLRERSTKHKSINKYLNRLAGLVGIKKHISTHTARRSFSNLLLDKTRDILKIKEALGHSSLEVTERYIRDMSPEENDDIDLFEE